MSIFEAGMMFCFGISWPFQVTKTYKSKNVKGKSIFFLWLIEIGYLCGMLHKIIYNFDWVIALYFLNFLLVGTDMFLYYKYRNLSIDKINLQTKFDNSMPNNSKNLATIK